MRRKKTLARLGVLLFVAAAAACVYSLFVDARREGIRRDVASHLRSILFELKIYDVNYNRLPHAIELTHDGEPMHSWRFIACRMMFGGHGNFYGHGAEAAHTEPWDSPANKRYFDGPYPDCTASPTSFVDPTRPGNKTRFVAITGPNTAFDGQHDISLRDVPPDAILVVEVRNSEQHWMKPGGDFHVSSMPQYIPVMDGTGISGRDPNGFFVGFANGEAWLLSNSMPFEMLSNFFTIESASQHSKDALLEKYRLWPQVR